MKRLTKRYTDGTYAAADDLPCGENSYDFKALLISTLGKFEDAGLEPEEIRALKDKGGWILVSERLPEEKENPITGDFYEYQVAAKFETAADVRHYKFGRGKWWNGGSDVTEYVIAWQPLPKPYKPKE